MARKQSNPTNSNKPFPSALRTLMEARNTSQKDLADYLGKTRQAVSLYCNGESAPDLETLVKIAQLFDTSTDYLLGLETDPAQKPSAVDELGLEPCVIHEIRQIRTGLLPGNRMAQEGLNIFLKESLKTDALFYRYICHLRGSIEAENSATTSDLTIFGAGDDSSMNTADRYRMAEVMIWKTLEEAYPGITSRMHFTFGPSSIKPRIDELCDMFREMLEHITGYRDFVESRNQ